MFKTRITTLFGIEHPIIGGSMQWVSRAELVAAVSNAGGLGILSALTFTSPEDLQQEITKTRSLTRKPFAVNVTLMPSVRPPDYEAYLDAAIKADVPVIETAGRLPDAAQIKKVKQAGIKIMHKVAAVRHVRAAERAGMDVVSIVGFEAGGHPGMLDITSLVQIPLAVDSVKIPVIGGGGVADARGFVAVLALGAEGVLLGTRFMASEESCVHSGIKEWLVHATERDTIIIERSINNAARVMKTQFTEDIQRREQAGATLEELLPLISGVLERRAILETGEVNSAVIHCGQAVGLIRDIPTAKEIIDGIIDGARRIVGQLNGFPGSPSSRFHRDLSE